jgi:hypothetical protein
VKSVPMTSTLPHVVLAVHEPVSGQQSSVQKPKRQLKPDAQSVFASHAVPSAPVPGAMHSLVRTSLSNAYAQTLVPLQPVLGSMSHAVPLKHETGAPTSAALSAVPPPGASRSAPASGAASAGAGSLEHAIDPREVARARQSGARSRVRMARRIRARVAER